MKNKGFTLVELLAVIVVLAVISIITIPMIENVIEESKKKSLEQSASGLIEAASYYKISHEGVTEFVFDENKKGETIKGDKLEYKGNIEGTGKLYIDKNGDISLCLADDKYYVYKNYNSGIYVGEVKDNSCIIGYDVLTNKYVAMLDDGTGQISNVYSKDEVNNLIDNVDSKVTTNKNEITNIKSTIETLQSSLNETNTNLNDLSNVVDSHTEAINDMNNNLTDSVVHFPDMSNVIASMENTNTSSDCSYTATQNCWAYYQAYKHSANAANDCIIYLNGKPIAVKYLSGTYQSVYVFIPLKAGDTIKFNTTGFYKQYQIYGVR